MAVGIADVFSSDPRKRATNFITDNAGRTRQVVNPNNLPMVRPIAEPPALPTATPAPLSTVPTLGRGARIIRGLGKGATNIAVGEALLQAASATANQAQESGAGSVRQQYTHNTRIDDNGLPSFIPPTGQDFSTLGITASNPVTGVRTQSFSPTSQAKPQSIAGPVQPLQNEAQLRQQWINTEQDTSAQAQIPSAAAGLPSIADPNGFAMVGDKRVSYRDIGTAADPLKAEFNGSGVVQGQEENSYAITDRLINDQNIRLNNERLANQQFVAVPMYGAGGRIIGWRSEIATPANAFNGQSIAAIAGDPNDPRYAENMGRVLQAQEQQRRGIADVETARYVADQGVAGHKLTADATVKAHELDATGREKAAIAKAANDQQVEFGKRVDWHLNNIKNLRMPKGFEGKHAEIAKDLAAADDPTKDVGVYYAPGQPHRPGIVTKKSVFDALLAKYQQQGYSDLDAYSWSVGDLKTMGQQKKTRLYRNIPNLEALTEREKKPSELTNIGA